LVFEAPEEEIDIVIPIIKKEMENAIKTQVPLLVEVGVGNNWLEAH
jgi:DNA polymerase-1